MEHKTLALPETWIAHWEQLAPVIRALHARFAPGLKIAMNGDGAALHLHTVDMRRWRGIEESLSPVEAAFVATVRERIAAVRSYGIRGGKRVYVGYAAERKVKGRKKKEQSRRQSGLWPFFYAKAFPRENMGLPEAFRNRILCADSEAALKALPDNCVDLIFTSPPYNFGLEYKNGADDADPWQAYFSRLNAIWDECVRVLKYGGRLVVNVQPLYSDYIPSHHFISQHLIKRGLIWKGEILWEKNNYNCKYTAWGSWRSPSSPYLKYSWEFVEVFCKGSLKKEGASINADIAGEDFKKWVYGKWSIAPERNMKAYGHPAMFPEELARRVIQLFSFKGDTVLDPFCGAGTTCVSAAKLGRGYLGVDISKEYCAVAEKRIESAMGLFHAARP